TDCFHFDPYRVLRASFSTCHPTSATAQFAPYDRRRETPDRVPAHLLAPPERACRRRHRRDSLTAQQSFCERFRVARPAHPRIRPYILQGLLRTFLHSFHTRD